MPKPALAAVPPAASGANGSASPPSLPEIRKHPPHTHAQQDDDALTREELIWLSIGGGVVAVALVIAGVVFKSAAAFFVLLILGAIAFAAFFILRHRRHERRAVERQFRTTLTHALKDLPLEQFSFSDLVARTGVAPRFARRVAEEVYGEFVHEVVADSRISETERDGMKRFARALELPDRWADAIASRIKQEKYKEHVRNALADGAVSEAESKHLAALARSLGLRFNDVRAASGRQGDRAYVERFRSMARRGSITLDDVRELARFRQATGMSDDDAARLVRRDAMNLYRERFVEAKQDGHISKEEEGELSTLQRFLRLPDADIAQFKHEIQRIRYLEDCRNGKLPSEQTRLILEGGEICHWDGNCTYCWQTPSGNVNEAAGQLCITSNRILFSSETKNFSFKPSKIMDIELYGDGVNLRANGAKGTGWYLLADPELAEAVLYGLVRKHKYLRAENLSSSKSRHIPDDIKREVWTRDGGCCVKCSATDYLEFDHIIPHSKGGANTVGNTQLLCRKCNLLKSDRI